MVTEQTAREINKTLQVIARLLHMKCVNESRIAEIKMMPVQYQEEGFDHVISLICPPFKEEVKRCKMDWPYGYNRDGSRRIPKYEEEGCYQSEYECDDDKVEEDEAP